MSRKIRNCLFQTHSMQWYGLRNSYHFGIGVSFALTLFCYLLILISSQNPWFSRVCGIFSLDCIISTRFGLTQMVTLYGHSMDVSPMASRSSSMRFEAGTKRFSRVSCIPVMMTIKVLEDLEKAAWYLNREIEHRKKNKF